MVNSSIFSERLNELIFDKKISLGTLSQVLNIDLSSIYKYLSKINIPSTPNAIKLANYFNCSLDFLFGLTNESPESFQFDLKPFSVCFQKILAEKNCTRYQLRKKTFLAKQSVDDWYHGIRIPTIDNLIILAKHFNCSADYLLGREI